MRPLLARQAEADRRCRNRGSAPAGGRHGVSVVPLEDGCAGAGRLAGSDRRLCATRGFDVAPDLRHQLVLALERELVPQPLPELQPQLPAVEIAVEVEQEGLDPQLVADGVRGSTARARRTVTVGRT